MSAGPDLADRLARALADGASRDLDLLAGDRPGLDDGSLVPAAVLVAVTDRPEPGVLLTQRTETLRRHAGQVAFPGGRIDPDDADAIAAALREAEEEIGLPRAVPQVVGTAARYHTFTGYTITPVLAVIPPDLPLVPHAAEVAAIFEVPLAHLLDPAALTEHHVRIAGGDRSYFEIRWPDRRIWGVTAAIIVNLARRLAPLPA